jgi:hypothetical protein
MAWGVGRGRKKEAESRKQELPEGSEFKVQELPDDRDLGSEVGPES